MDILNGFPVRFEDFGTLRPAQRRAADRAYARFLAEIPAAGELESGQAQLCLGCGRRATPEARMCGRLACAWTDLLPVLRTDPWSGTTDAQVAAWCTVGERLHGRRTRQEGRGPEAHE